MLRSADDTATLLALMFERSGQTRIRVSQKTIKFLGYRMKLRASFVLAVSEVLSNYYDITMIELDNGAFGLFRTSSLEGAKAFTAKRLLEDMLPDLKKGKHIDYEKLDKEITAADHLELDE
ncbi:Segregation and condensation protein B [Pseudomonas sp. IT-P74]|uniref:hypothetical protein n=1 Tax=Pseudomonas sp. IT-P74 TaxID=3026445 RepID=UPI0039E0C966